MNLPLRRPISNLRKIVCKDSCLILIVLFIEHKYLPLIWYWKYHNHTLKGLKILDNVLEKQN